MNMKVYEAANRLAAALQEDQKDPHTYDNGNWIYSISVTNNGIRTIHMQWPRFKEVVRCYGKQRFDFDLSNCGGDLHIHALFGNSNWVYVVIVDRATLCAEIRSCGKRFPEDLRMKQLWEIFYNECL